MARIFTDGAEFGDVLFFNPTGSISASTSQKRSGAYSYRHDQYAQEVTKSFTGLDEFYLRYGLRIDSDTWARMLRFKSNNNGSTEMSMVHSSGKLYFYRGSSEDTNLLISSAGIISPATWHLIEIHFKLHDTSGAIDLKVDGVPCGSYSGDTKNGSYTTVDAIVWYMQGVNYYFDDIALNSTDNSDGKNDNSWCGEGKIELLVPNGNGSLNEWTGSDGNSTDNYALVDDIPASSTDYVENSTAGNKDKYAVTDFDASGKSILRVWAEGRAIDTVPEGAQMKIGVRTNSTDYVSSAITLGTNYGVVKGTEYKVNPNDSAAWEDADLDGIELVLETV